MIGVAGGAVALITAAGRDLPAPSATVAPLTAARPASAGSEVLLQVLLALVVVIIAARLCGALCRRFHQPAVIGEVIAGILLGPSLLGRISPDAMHAVLPSSAAPYLSIIAQIGVILFMFLVGLQLDAGQLRHRTHATISISHASILAPFVLGCALALWLYPRLGTENVPFTVFALFVGVSLSVTAFPVLARILTDRGLQDSHMGVVALTCAAVDDVTAWCLLAVVVAIAKVDATGALRTLLLTAGYIAVMLLVVRPIVVRAVRWSASRAVPGQTVMSVVVIGLLLSTLATEAAGIHAIFGAFLLGAVIPHDTDLARDLARKLEDLVIVLFLPAFFAFTGLRTEIGLVSSPTEWMICAVITLTASVGKFGGSFAAARFAGFDRRDATSLGILMNTRGLMELIVLNLGLDLGILSPTLFTMLVLMAVLTTLATTPILDLVQRRTGTPGGRMAVA
jgi:Kef-type K+ transport system membrane component KefB